MAGCPGNAWVRVGLFGTGEEGLCQGGGGPWAPMEGRVVCRVDLSASPHPQENVGLDRCGIALALLTGDPYYYYYYYFTTLQRIDAKQNTGYATSSLGSDGVRGEGSGGDRAPSGCPSSAQYPCSLAGGFSELRFLFPSLPRGCGNAGDLTASSWCIGETRWHVRNRTPARACPCVAGTRRSSSCMCPLSSVTQELCQ